MPTKLSLADALDIYKREELDQLVADKGAEARGLWPPDYNEFKKILPELFRRLTVVDMREGAMAGGYWDFDNYDDSDRYACEINAARKKGLPDSVVEPPAPPDFIPDPDLPRLRGVTITLRRRVSTTGWSPETKMRELLTLWVQHPQSEYGRNRAEVARRLAEEIAKDTEKPFSINHRSRLFKRAMKAAVKGAGDTVDPTWTKHHARDRRSRACGPSHSPRNRPT